MNVDLERLYSRSESPVAFVDESYKIEGENRYYILACALVMPANINDTRQALLDCYGGEPMHAAPMFANREHQALRGGIEVSAAQHDGIDVIIQCELDPTDSDGTSARRRCIEHVVSTIHHEESTTLFVFDALRSTRLERLDHIAISDLKKSRQIGRDVSGIHTRPSIEPLLCLPDLLAWTYRRKIAAMDESWFAPFEPLARIHQI